MSARRSARPARSPGSARTGLQTRLSLCVMSVFRRPERVGLAGHLPRGERGAADDTGAFQSKHGEPY